MQKSGIAAAAVSVVRGINHLFAKMFIALVRFYQLFVSPLFPPCCRFTPTCSQYALEAFKKYGAVKGLNLTVRRILRCNPWHEGGYDPVP